MTALQPTNILGDSSGSGRFADFFGGLAMVFDDCVPWACALVDLRLLRRLLVPYMPLASALANLYEARVDVLRAERCSFERCSKSFGRHS